MLAYRIFPYLADAKTGQPGHPLYQHRPQHGGRIDHPDYYVWYLGTRPEVACGEVFGDLQVWDDSMLEFPLLGARRALGVFSLPDELRVCDLDDAKQLVRLGLRPTQVVARNIAVTQSWGHQIWSETMADGADQRWQAVRWWSYHRPSWPVLASWVRPKLERVELLDLDHPAIVDAAAALNRPISH